MSKLGHVETVETVEAAEEAKELRLCRTESVEGVANFPSYLPRQLWTADLSEALTSTARTTAVHFRLRTVRTTEMEDSVSGIGV
jgi:hypothetical protein